MYSYIFGRYKPSASFVAPNLFHNHFYLNKKHRIYTMKRISIILILIHLIVLNLAAQKSKTVTVDDINQFVKAIGSDKIIRLKTSKLIVSNAVQAANNEYLTVKPVEKGWELEIRNVKNLKIIGTVNQPVKLITNTRQAAVLSFKNCENIVISHVEAGHAAGKGVSKEGVLVFKDCKNIQINESVVSGSGSEGLTFLNVKEVSLKNLTIKGCSSGAMTVKNSSNIYFEGGRLTNNQAFDLISIFDSENITFEKCKIDFNRAGKGQEYDAYTLFNVLLDIGVTTNIVTLKECTIEDNYCQYFCKSTAAVKVENCKLDNNIFEKGYNITK